MIVLIFIEAVVSRSQKKNCQVKLMYRSPLCSADLFCSLNVNTAKHVQYVSIFSVFSLLEIQACLLRFEWNKRITHGLNINKRYLHTNCFRREMKTKALYTNCFCPNNLFALRLKQVPSKYLTVNETAQVTKTQIKKKTTAVVKKNL